MERISSTRPSWPQVKIVNFEYAAMPYVPETDAIYAMEEERAGSAKAAAAEDLKDGTHSIVDQELIAEETRRAFADGREQGVSEGRRLEREANAAAMRAAEERRMGQIAEALNKFAQESDRYLHQVESEVVRLALAVAARILRREAQMDPLLLTGAVRVALGQLSGTTKVCLRVPISEVEMWKESIALFPNLAGKPEVMAGEGMHLGDCTIEAALGSVDLGVRSQLGEIERGFFDVAARAGAVRYTDENVAQGGEAK